MGIGKLIVMEGACDGIGKSTQYKLLADRLANEGREIVTHHFPSYGTNQGRLVEEYLSGEYGTPSELSPYFVNSLYAVDRKITWDSKLKKAYDDGLTILLDRYTTSSLIYQAALMSEDEKKKFVSYVCDYEYEKLGIQKPDKVIFLKAPFELVTKMRNKRQENDGIVNDIHESDIDFMRKVYDSALFLSEYLNWNVVECTHGNNMASIDEIHEKVYKLVNN